MDYYRNSVTQQSWEFLVQLKKRYHVVLIGGWAVWLYTHRLKSKDIDLVVDLPILEALKLQFDFTKNERLKKYEFRQREVAVDVYTSYFSDPGIPAARILADQRLVEGFLVPSREALLVLKTVAWNARKGSAKGRKDFLDIVSLLETGVLSPGALRDWLTARNAEMLADLVDALKRTTAILELDLSTHKLARAKKQWMEVLV